MSNDHVAQDKKRDVRRDKPNLDSRYGEIGISAVAAALQFQCKRRKNPAYARVALRPDKRRPSDKVDDQSKKLSSGRSPR
jgi:hypothetical protein